MLFRSDPFFGETSQQTGVHPNDSAWTVATSTGDYDAKKAAVLYEDMSVGALMSFGPTAFSFKAGGVLWNEMSPLTVWKTQPRMFGWDYLPYELEQSTAMFYDYATVKGFKEGRAAWNKKPFQGIQLESIELPWQLSFNTFYGFYEGYRKNYPWIVPADKTNELQYTDVAIGNRTAANKGIGYGDNYRPVWFLRLAKAELPGGITAGANWFQYLVDTDYSRQWNKVMRGVNAVEGSGSLTGAYDLHVIQAAGFRSGRWVNRSGGIVYDDTLSNLRYMSNYYLEPRIGSVDFKRNIPGGLTFHVDVGFSNLDSVWFKVGGQPRTGSGTPRRFAQFKSSELDSVSTLLSKATSADTTLLYNEVSRYSKDFRDKVLVSNPWDVIGRTSTGWKPAVYASVGYALPMVDLELKTVYLDKNFHSGASTVAPIDGIFPYEANMTGPGKFAGVDNGTSHASNLTGANLIAKLPVPRGHARVSMGLHVQPEKGQDMIFFPWRQNGAAFNATLNSNISRYGVGLLDDGHRDGKAWGSANTTQGANRQIRRLGDESYFRGNEAPSPTRPSYHNPYAPTPGDAGGVRADYMAIYEGFAPYKLSKNFHSKVVSGSEWTAQDSLTIRQIAASQDSFLFRLQSKKATQNLSLDLAYEISRLWSGKQSVFLAGYAAFNSVTRGVGTGIPAFTTGDDVLLMGRNLRFEPVFQVTPKFYVIGLVSNEVWQSDYGVALIDSASGLAPGDDASWLVGDLRGGYNADGIANLRAAPIDYSDWMYGLGFDWDIAPRVGLHVRAQYITHEDKGVSVDASTAAKRNDYRAWLATTEMKMWF